MTSPLLSALTASTPGPDMNAATQTAAHWLEIMPTLPLAAGVPVTLENGDPERWSTFGVVVAPGSCPRSYHPQHAEVQIVDSWDAVRVDLDDPQGFGYALRYACQHCDPAISYLWPAMASRWMRGETTGTDRLALAQALAEVQA